MSAKDQDGTIEGSDLPRQERFTPGQTVSHYRILELLGRGGMGVVFKALDLNLDRVVALKFLSTSRTADESATRRFVLEAKAASALEHDHICTIHEIGLTDDHQIFIAMAFYDGQTVDRMLSKGPLGVETSLKIVREIAAGLAEVHAKGITHRDVKPANALVTLHGSTKILDFGLARLGGEQQLTETGNFVGTVAYMSPEQLRGEVADSRSDIWSLGVMFYEMLTGRRPFRGESHATVIRAILDLEPEPVGKLQPGVPDALVRVMNRMLEKNLESRYASMKELLTALSELDPSTAGVRKQRIPMKRVFVVGLILLLLLSLLAVWGVRHASMVRWSRNEAIPEIQRLIETEEYSTAYDLATRAERFIPDDPILVKLWSKFSTQVSIDSVPPGAKVSAKRYGMDQNPRLTLDKQWRFLGQTPITKLRVPDVYQRLRIEREGYSARDVIQVDEPETYTLSKNNSLPEDMVLVSGGSSRVQLPGLEHLEPQRLDDFLMDKYEVTNKAYQRFVEQGGYKRQDYWKYPIFKDKRQLSWDEAMVRFTDRTGQPGPATWEAGDYPEGEDQYPVTGVSWYEAAAYAEFIGKDLPTIYHWSRAAGTWLSDIIVPLSNFNNRGPTSVGANEGMGPYGNFDMAGNVREWCLNQSTRADDRFILGGGWNDAPYAFNDAYAQAPLDRSSTNGFRCTKYLEEHDNHDAIAGIITLPFRDFRQERPVSDEMFKVLVRQYDYDKRSLNAVRDFVDRNAEDYVMEKISFDAAYGGERMCAFLFLPKRGTPPYQTIVYFPGDSDIYARSSKVLYQIRMFDFLLKNGRAVIYPVYKSTFERGDKLTSTTPNESNDYKEHVIMWVKDVRRSVDYLETRDDIDKESLGYYGFSWGGRVGPIVVALERRFKVCLLNIGGLRFQRTLPEVDPFNFVSRVMIPTLMLNGRYDHYFPLETSQEPMFELLGVQPERKRHVVYEGGHSVPRSGLIGESLPWLDRYLGPVGDP